MPAGAGPRRLLPGNALAWLLFCFVSYFETGHALSDFLL